MLRDMCFKMYYLKAAMKVNWSPLHKSPLSNYY